MDQQTKDPDVLNVLVLERLDRAKNMARYYVLSVEPTLFANRRLCVGGAGSARRANTNRPSCFPPARADSAQHMARTQAAPGVPTPRLIAGSRLFAGQAVQELGSQQPNTVPRSDGRFLTRGLRAVKAEAALSVLAFKILHAVNAFGTTAIRRSSVAALVGDLLFGVRDVSGESLAPAIFLDSPPHAFWCRRPPRRARRRALAPGRTARRPRWRG